MVHILRTYMLKGNFIIKNMERICLSFIAAIVTISLYAQPVPNVEENIPHLMTFGNAADESWGDDDFSQAFFFLIPKDFKQQVFIRIYDPDTGGDIDEIAGAWNTKCSYEVFGGKSCWSDVDARETSPIGNYKSGVLLGTKIFGENPRYDKNWYTFGPFDPAQGEFVEMFDGYVFKIICEGIAGDDGNMYNYFISTSGTENIPIEGANAFAYEYSFRMHNDPYEVSHIYPYIDEATISVKISNFDWDSDGDIIVVSVARQGQKVPVSGEDKWAQDELKVLDEEHKTSWDFQFVKSKQPLVKNNNVVVNVRNQYDETMPFYTSPIGGVPKYKYSTVVEPVD